MTRALWAAGVVRVKRGRNPATGAPLWGVYWVEDDGYNMQAFYDTERSARRLAQAVSRVALAGAAERDLAERKAAEHGG